MKENKVYKKDGKLVVQFTFTKGSSMVDMEEQIESLIASIDGSVSEPEKQTIKTQLQDAIRMKLKNEPAYGGERA
jgi:hypothetical protein